MSEDIMAKALDIQGIIEYQDDSVVSREVIKKEWDADTKNKVNINPRKFKDFLINLLVFF